jgi:surfeit locus 1 family protein
VGAFTGLRNLLYALEWWFFGLFAAFIWWRWVTDTTAEEAAAEEADTPTPAGP